MQSPAKHILELVNKGLELQQLKTQTNDENFIKSIDDYCNRVSKYLETFNATEYMSRPENVREYLVARAKEIVKNNKL